MFALIGNNFGTLWSWILLPLEIAALVFGLGHVILKQREARQAAFWAVIIIFVPFLGAIFYSFFGINLLRRKGRKYRNGKLTNKTQVGDAVPANPWAKFPEIKLLRRLATTLGRLSRYEFTDGNKILIYPDGDTSMPAMLEAIKGAKRSITFCSYIFEAKGIGQKFVDELVAAKNRGVEVRVMVDDAGTRYARPPVTRMLSKKGVKAVRFMPDRFILRLLTMNLRNHRKILVVDGCLGFTGGMNIRQGNMLSENPKSPVRDMHFRVEGPVVRQLQRSFAEDWAYCAGEVLTGDLWYPEIAPCGDVSAIGIPDGPDEDLEVIPKAIFAAINAAHREIRVMTPYFLPDPQIQWALILASLRGVDVKILTPSANNIPPVRWAAHTLYPMLLKRGVKIFECNGMFDHTKFMTVDGSWSLIGSTNWDPRSLRLNFEFNVACFDEKLAGELNAEFLKKSADSVEMTLHQLRTASVGVRLRNGIARMFIPMM